MANPAQTRTPVHPAAVLASAAGRYPWLVVGMLWTIGFFNYADRQAIYAIFPVLGAQLHLNLAELGLMGSAFAWVYGLFAPAAGWVVDRIRRKTAILAGLEFWSAVCAATALAAGLRTFVCLRGLMGLAESFYFPASLSMMGDYHRPATRSRALGIHQTSVYAGTIFGGFFAGWIASRYSWQLAFVCFGLAGVVLGIVLLRFLREPGRGAGDIPELPSPVESSAARSLGFLAFLRLAVRTPAVWLLMLAFACANFVAVVLLAWMPSYLYSEYHLSLALAGLAATALIQIGSIGGTVWGGWLADSLQQRRRDGRILVQAAGVLCGSPFVFLSSRTGAPALMIAALILWGICKGLYDANIFASLFDVIPAGARGTATGCMNTVGWLLGGGVAPVLTGLLAERLGLGEAIGFSSLAYIAAGVLLLVAGRHLKMQTPATDARV